MYSFQLIQKTCDSVEECRNYANRITNKLKEVKKEMQTQIQHIQETIKKLLGRFVGNVLISLKSRLGFVCF